MKSKNQFDHYKEPICKIWFDENGGITATEIGFELIRCKDCKHWHTGYCPMAYREYEYSRGNEPLDYCSLAERKEE